MNTKNPQLEVSTPGNVIAAFLTQTLKVDGDTLKFEIWDTAGQERYHSLAPMYYRGAHAAIVVYDISSHDSFERAKGWVKELQRQASANIVICLVGNKSDLVATRQVEASEAIQYASEMNLLFSEASALTGENIGTLFDTISKKLPRTEQNLATSRSMSGIRRVELKYDTGSADQQSQSKCC